MIVSLTHITPPILLALPYHAPANALTVAAPTSFGSSGPTSSSLAVNARAAAAWTDLFVPPLVYANPHRHTHCALNIVASGYSLHLLLATTSLSPLLTRKMPFNSPPPPSEQCYLEIDDAYCSWHLKRFAANVDPRTHVIPLQRALQGHPKAGVLWEKLIVGILEGPELQLRSTTHKRNLYHGTFRNKSVLICRQVDDFVIATDSRPVAEAIIKIINRHVTTATQGTCEPTDNGIFA
jgi:hypothetical protein